MSNPTSTPAIQTPAPLPIALKLADKNFQIPNDAQKVMLTRTPSGWELQEVATIGESDLLVIRNEKGIVKAFKKTVRLSESKKEIATVAKSTIITVVGYNRLNQVAGLHAMTPSSIIIDGKEQSNPFVEYDSKGEAKKVIVRKMAIGYSPVGNLVVTDVVRHYNFDAYYMQDLQSKAKWKPDAARFGTELSCPFAPDAQIEYKNDLAYCKEKGKIYLFKRVKDIEGIWINPASEEIAEVYNSHTQHQKFGEVIAQNVALRNALKSHPAIATTNVIAQNGTADVTVYGYRSTLGKEQAEDIARKIEKGEQVDNVQVEHSVEEASYEEVSTELSNEATEAEATENKTTSTPTPAPAPEVKKPEPKPEPKPQPKSESKPAPKEQKKTLSIEEQIEAEAKGKGIKLPTMIKNLFGMEDEAECSVDKLNDFQKDKLLKVLKGVQGNGGAK